MKTLTFLTPSCMPALHKELVRVLSSSPFTRSLCEEEIMMMPFSEEETDIQRLSAAHQVTQESYSGSSNAVSGISVHIINHLIKIIRRIRRHKLRLTDCPIRFP